MPTNKSNSKKETLYSIKNGAAYTRTIGTVRELKTYPLNENELYSITWFNTLTSVFASIATTILLFGIGLKQDAIVQNVLTEQAKLLTNTGFWLCLILALLFYALALALWFGRRSMLHRILRETKVKE
ncbi:MAG: hypothetical protein FJ005_03120 [Chloroflexi bacterium]|nr:hypothetical protein [Chloroflexota bacterium]